MSRDREERGGRDRDRGGRESTRPERGGRDREDSRDSGRGREEPRGASRDRGGRDSGRGATSSRSSYQYQRRDPNDTKRRAEEGGGDSFDNFISRDAKKWKPQDGDNTIRILPPTWDGPKHWGLDVWVHYGVGPDRETYLCIHKMKGDPCPICDERKQAARDGDDDYAKELEPRRRVLVYLVDRDDEREGGQVYAMPQGLDQDITKVSVDKKTGDVLNIDDPEEGFDVSFEKSGQGKKTRYEGAQIARRESPLDNEDAMDEAVANPLPGLLVYYDYDHIKDKFGGGGGSHRSERDRDDGRDRDRGGEDRGRGTSDRGERGGDSQRSERGGRDRGRSQEPDLTWESVHAMTGQELDDLVELHKLDIKVNDADSDEQLADWICEDLKVTKQERAAGRERTRVNVDAGSGGGESASDKMREMRERRPR